MYHPMKVTLEKILMTKSVLSKTRGRMYEKEDLEKAYELGRQAGYEQNNDHYWYGKDLKDYSFNSVKAEFETNRNLSR